MREQTGSRYAIEVRPTFPDPYEFLEDFRQEDLAYEGLKAHLAHEVVTDTTHHRALSFAENMALDIDDQGNYALLIRGLLEQRYGRLTRAADRYQPLIGASINYLKFRLAVGLLSPAVDTALSRTDPAHTRVRAHRTIVAVDMVRSYVDDQFSDFSSYISNPTSFLEADVRAILLAHFTGTYHRSAVDNPDLADRYIDSAARMPECGPDTDEFRFFDIKDFSSRLLFTDQAKPDEHGRLLSADEYEAMMKSSLAAARKPVVTYRQDDERDATEVLTPEEQVIVTSQVIAEAFKGMGILPVKLKPQGVRKVHDVLTEEYTIGRLDRVLPGGQTLAGRRLARNVAFSLLSRLADGASVRKNANHRIELSEEDRKVAIERLTALIDYYSREWMTVDALYRAGETDYIMRYGDIPEGRDFIDLML